MNSVQLKTKINVDPNMECIIKGTNKIVKYLETTYPEEK